MKAPRIRSFIIAPANRPDLVTKFSRYPADCSVMDLEDGTPPAEKVSAREGLAQMVASLRDAGFRRMLGVRVNEPWSDGYIEDLAFVCALPIDVVVIPKLESTDQLFPAVHAIRRAERRDPRGRCIMAGIESMRGVTNVARLCNASPEVTCLYFGAEDFVSDVGGVRTHGSAEVQYARSSVLLHAKQAGLTALDQVVTDIRNDELFRQDAMMGKSIGYDGKVCLLPRQVELANQVFSPSPDELQYAARLVAAYADAVGRGVGTIDFEGKMIDGPLLKRAQRMLELADS